MKKSISIYVNSEGIAPSGYYRVLQYFKDYQYRVVVHSLIPNSIYIWWHKRSNKQRIIFSPFLYMLIFMRTVFFLLRDCFNLNHGYLVISKFIQPHYISFIHLFLLYRLSLNNKIIWDFDDNILDSHSISKREFNFLAKYSSKIIVISDFLKSLIPLQYQEKVFLLATTDGDMRDMDIDSIIEKRKKNYGKQLNLVWVATASNLCYLERIIRTLDDAALLLKETHNKQLILDVVCNKPLIYETKYLILNNIVWDRAIAQEKMAIAHVGIMPLVINRFTLGKGGFKLVQYLSVGLPLIASNVGFNKEIVTNDCGLIVDDEYDLDCWKQAIIFMASDWGKYHEMILAALEQYEKKFSYENNLKCWINWCEL